MAAVHRHARLYRRGGGFRHLVDPLPDPERSALGDRGPHPHPCRPAQRIHDAVANCCGALGFMGNRRSPFVSALWPLRYRFHSPTGPHRGFLWCGGGHHLLPVCGVRVAPGRGAGFGHRTTATSPRARNHGPNPDGVDAVFRHADDRHRPDRPVLTAAAQSHPAPTRGRDPDYLCSQPHRRIPIDVDPGLVDDHPGTGGAGGVAAGRGG